MADKNNKNKRKFAAVLLGIVGVAGLSVASASTLDVTNDTEVALGTVTFDSCDDAVKVDYSYDTTAPYNITSVSVTDIDAKECVGEDITLDLGYDLDGKSATSGDTGTLELAGTVSGATFTWNKADNFATTALTVKSDLGEAVVMLGDLD